MEISSRKKMFQKEKGREIVSGRLGVIAISYSGVREGFQFEQSC